VDKDFKGSGSNRLGSRRPPIPMVRSVIVAEEWASLINPRTPTLPILDPTNPGASIRSSS